MANHALNEFRKSFKAKLGKKRNKVLKQDRYVLLKREHKLQAFPHRGVRDTWFGEFPELKTAYYLKEDFFKIYDCKTKSEAIMKYNTWKSSIPDDLEVFKEIVETVDNWHTEIFNYFDHRITNAFVEGTNSVIRDVEKRGRGYSFEVLRAKIIYYINHKVEYPKKPKYASNSFSNMMGSYGGGNFFDDYVPPKDYGVAFDDILKYFR